MSTYKRLEWHDRMQPKQAESGRRIWQINWLRGGNAVGTDDATHQRCADEAGKPMRRT